MKRTFRACAMIAGLIDYLEGGLQDQDAERNSNQEFRDDSDPVGTFINSCCMVTGEEKDRIPSRDLVQITARHDAVAHLLDAARLRAMGVAAVYTPKDFELNRIMMDIVGLVDRVAVAAE